MEAHPPFTAEASSLPFLFNPVSAAAFFSTLFFCFIVSPPIRIYLGKICTAKLPKSSNMHFDTLLASTIHAVLAVTFSSYSLAFGLLETYRVFSKSSLGFVTLQVSLGYFVADLVIILLDPKLRSDKASLMHHIAGIVGLVLSLHFQGKLMYYLIFRLISELSTPFVNMRWVLYEFRITNGILYRAAAYGMMATFFFTRIITMPWFWYDFYYCFMHPGIVIVPDFFKVWAVCNFSAFDVLNLYWFYKMVRGAMKLYSSHNNQE